MLIDSAMPCAGPPSALVSAAIVEPKTKHRTLHDLLAVENTAEVKPKLKVLACVCPRPLPIRNLQLGTAFCTCRHMATPRSRLPSSAPRQPVRTDEETAWLFVLIACAVMQFQTISVGM